MVKRKESKLSFVCDECDLKGIKKIFLLKFKEKNKSNNNFIGIFCNECYEKIEEDKNYLNEVGFENGFELLENQYLFS